MNSSKRNSVVPSRTIKKPFVTSPTPLSHVSTPSPTIPAKASEPQPRLDQVKSAVRWAEGKIRERTADSLKDHGIDNYVRLTELDWKCTM